MDFKKYIPEIEKKIHYTFKDKSLLIQAFTRTSFCNEKNYGGKANYMSNEVLEFFGDSVLSTAIISLLLDKRTKRYEHGITTALTEGDFSNIRSKLSDKRNLSLCTAELGLQKYLRMGEGDEKLGICNEPSVMEDLFESIIGAIYIDCGMEIKPIIAVVSKILNTTAYESAEPPMQSFKNALQEWCADKKHRLGAPIYKTASESGPDHRKVYERAVYIDGKLCGTGKGKNIKLADAAAAEAALAYLKSEAKSATPAAKEALSELKNLAAKNKLPTPEFRDLGETENSNSYDREFRIECRFAGKCAHGIGKSKQDARANAAAKLLEEIKLEEAAKTKKPTATKKSGKKTPEAPKEKKLITAPKNKTRVKEEQKNKPPVPKSERASSRESKPKRAPLHHKKHL